MKAVSTVIATLLMLIITIALAGVAYTYISGVFTARTAVALSVEDAFCDPNLNKIYVVVRNDGTTDATNVNVTVAGVGSLTSYITVPSGQVVTAEINGYASGAHTVIVTSPNSVARSTVICQ